MWAHVHFHIQTERLRVQGIRTAQKAKDDAKKAKDDAKKAKLNEFKAKAKEGKALKDLI